MSIEPTDKAYAGQAIYNPATLALYNIVVLGISNRLIWRCPTRHILQLYNQHATDNHLDVGVGTGRCRVARPLKERTLNQAPHRLHERGRVQNVGLEDRATGTQLQLLSPPWSRDLLRALMHWRACSRAPEERRDIVLFVGWHL